MDTSESVKLLARVDERTQLMKERLDDFIEQSQENCSRCFEDHEKRLRILEIWQWRTTGLAAGVAAGITYIGNIFLNGWAG